MTNPYGPVPPPPTGGAPGTLDANQKTVLGCGVMAAVALVLVLVAGACSPDPQAGQQAVPGPTVTVTARETVTAPPAAAMPELVGDGFADARQQTASLTDGGLTAYSAYADVGLPTDHDDWTVCFQSPAGGTSPLSRQTALTVHLVAAGTKCPAEQGGKLHKPKPAPKPKPKPTPTPAPDEEDDSSSSSTGGGGGGGSVYYRNCDAARDAGAAPVRTGDPGYGRHLDRDGDGVACE
ncbi:excalibur calcium-binding domain-containing protein [Streptomyces sp. NPDC006678]|uniref:excalibur calcium-binding domain-containing protein n=1 Tax=Streptomyces sp. NPDC006678 TaxID=3157185 RepID=UPI0033D9469E